MSGVPSEGNYRERLNAGAHIDKLVAKQQEEARKAHQDALKCGQAKIKAGNARRKSELDAARDELNRETASKAQQSWVDAAAHWISNAKRWEIDTPICYLSVTNPFSEIFFVMLKQFIRILLWILFLLFVF